MTDCKHKFDKGYCTLCGLAWPEFVGYDDERFELIAKLHCPYDDCSGHLTRRATLVASMHYMKLDENTNTDTFECTQCKRRVRRTWNWEACG